MNQRTFTRSLRSARAILALVLAAGAPAAAQCPEAVLPAPGDPCFGWDVALDGDTLAIGDVSHSGGGSISGQGAAYVYRWSGAAWELEAMLTASDGQSADSFGSSVDLDGDDLIVGAPGVDDAGQNSGAAYVFQRTATGWVERDKLRADDGGLFDNLDLVQPPSGARRVEKLDGRDLR